MLNKIIKDVGRMGVTEEGAHSRGIDLVWLVCFE